MKHKGMTLVEVIISIAILGIFAAAFLNMFSNGIITIFTMGNKTRAVAKAQEITDKAYESRDGDYVSVLNSLSNVSSLANLHTYESGKNSKYLLEDHTVSYTVDGITKNETYKKLTVVVFYFNGKRHVEIISLMPAGGIQ